MNIIEAIEQANEHYAKVRSPRLGAYYLQVEPEQVVEIITWHDLQHMTVEDANAYIPVSIEDGVLTIG